MFTYLIVLFLFLALLGIVFQYLLYKKGGRLFYFLNLVLVFILSFLNYSSLPTNYLGLKFLSLSWAGLSLLSLVLYLSLGDRLGFKFLMSFGLIAGFIQILL